MARVRVVPGTSQKPNEVAETSDQSVTGSAVVRTRRGAQSDQDLIEGIRAGCAGDFDELYERYFPRIYSFVYSRLRSHSDCEEIVQETFIVVFRSIETYRGTSSLLSWVYGIARNNLNNHIRNAHRHRERINEVGREHFAPKPSLSTITPAEQFEMDEYQRAVLSELDSVATWQAEIFVMRHFQDLSISEISARTQRSSDSVRSSLFRVKRVFTDRASERLGGMSR